MTLEGMINYYFDNAENPKLCNSKVLNTDTYRALQELKTLRVELEKNSKELEVCKKLLNTACDVILSIAPTCNKTRKDVMENLYLIIGGDKDEK